MKKVSLFLLSLLMVLTSFCACDNDKTDNSSEASQQHNSGETENSSTTDNSETSNEWVAPEPYIQTVKAPEKTVYFTEEYGCLEFTEYSLRVLGSKNILERMVYRAGSLTEYMAQNEVSDDTYFLVWIYYFDNEIFDDSYSSTEQASISRQKTLDFLKDYDYIDINDHPLIYDGKHIEDTNALDWSNDQNPLISYDLNELRTLFAKLDPSIPYETIKSSYENSTVGNLLFAYFPAVGYISAGALKEISQANLSENNRLYLFWLPAPNDIQRFFTCNSNDID